MKLQLPILFISLCSLLPSGAALAANSSPPNILVILADDLGYGDLSCHGGKIPTPHIDSIARNGMSFMEGYVTAPQCAPSRAGLLTGRYQQKFGFECNFDAPKGHGEPLPGTGLPAGEKTMADFLRAAGYHTGAVGKWHLGDEPQFHPLQRGFDEFFGFLWGSSHYMRPEGAPIPNLIRNNEPVRITSYLTDVLGGEACSYIEKNKDLPWFLYLAFNAPHTPLEATQNYLDRFPEIADPQARTYAAMVSALDDAVGRTLQTLKDLHLDGQTVIVFLSDNGAPIFVTRSASNGPLRGEKGDVLEGGVRVPFFVQWSGHIPAGVKIQSPVSTLDLLPSFLEMAGKPVPPDANLDGLSLLPTLKTGKEPQDDRAIFWLLRLGRNKALHSWGIRQGPWKFWRGPLRAEDGKQFFDEANSPKSGVFNIPNDIHEDHDLSRTEPEKRRELEAKLGEWMQTIQPPRWGDSMDAPPPLP